MNSLNCIGVGMVARNKQTNTDVCYVYPPSYFPAGDGEISGEVQTTEAKGLNKDGTENSSKVLSSNAIPAKWMNMQNPNRLTSPDVRIGSKVALYRWGDDPTIYWTTYGFSAETHRLETVIYGWNANPNTSKDSPFDYSTFYVFEVSTHTGRVAFRTSQSNGELTKHEFALDTKSGRLTYADGEQNVLAVDSKNHSFLFQNQEKSQFFISKKNIMLSCQEQLILSATKQLTINTKQLNINAETTNFISPKGFTLKGNATWQGNMTIMGNISSQVGPNGEAGDMSCSGAIKATGQISSDVDVIGGGVSLKNHKHQNSGGSGVGGPPVQ